MAVADTLAGLSGERLRALGIAGAVGVLTWPIESLRPEGGVDPSWKAGLHLAAKAGLDHGDEIVFTHGPLGFMAYPLLLFPVTAILAAATVTAAHFLAVWLVVERLLRSAGLLVAALGAFLVARAAISPQAAGSAPELLLALLAILCARSLLREGEREGPNALEAAGLAVLAAFLTLVKVNAGALGVALVVLTVLVPIIGERPERRRSLAIAGLGAGVYLAFVGLLWLAAGQSLGDLPSFFARTADLASGYSGAMSIGGDGRAWEYAVAVLAIGLVARLVVRETTGRRVATRLGVAAVVALFAAGAFRHGFTRHDFHSFYFFALVLIVVVAVFLRRGNRVAVALAAAPMVLACLVVLHTGPADLLDAPSRTRAAVDTVATLVLPGRNETERGEARAEVRASYDFPAEVIRLIADRTVHVDPWETTAVWAYPEMEWRPAPMFQSLSAWTADLDTLNARFLASAEAPEVVLRQPDRAIDGRDPRFESPRYLVEMICRYREAMLFPGWQVLERGGPRCGRAATIGRVEARFGEAVPVPAAGANEMVVASFTELERGLSQKVQSVLLKADPLRVAVSGGGDHRFVPGHAGSPHALRLPRCLGWSAPEFDASSYDSVALAVGAFTPNEQQPGGYTVTFARVPFDCA